jgi:hypothetical protein
VEKRFDKLEEKIDVIADQLASIDKTLVANTVILEEHQRRSLANEKAVEILESHLQQQIDPIAKHVHVVNLLGKVALTVLSSSLGFYVLQKALKLN